MASAVVMMIAGAALNATAFTGGMYLVNTLTSKKDVDEEQIRHDKALEKYKQDMGEFEKKRQQYQDWLTERYENKKLAEDNLHDTDYAFTLYKEGRTDINDDDDDDDYYDADDGTQRLINRGPSLNPLLYDILLRLRVSKIALVGDIEKAFLNIEVQEEDKDSLRFLWADDPSDLSKISVYRFCRVVFGVSSSPFLLNATLQHHIRGYTETDPGFAQKMLEGFYVDDLVTGGNDIEEVIQLYEKAKERMQSGGFKLRKWITNDEQVRGYITREEVGAQCEKGKDEISYAQTTVGVQMGSKGQKVLGLEWEREQDKIVFDLTAIHNKWSVQKKRKKATVGMVETSVDRGIQTVIDITKYSKYETVIRVTAWEWVKSTQNEMQGQENFKQLSKILQIVKDKEGILRCYGRMENAELDIDTREPIILSKNHKLTELIVQDCHVRVKHCGVRSTLAELRSKYWVPKGRQLIKRILARRDTPTLIVSDNAKTFQATDRALRKLYDNQE
ncbi:hypothetical protein QZH41_001452, partial [Actinostola sp. cb2023]